MKFCGEGEGDLLFTEDGRGGQFLIRISLDGLRGMCGRAFQNKSKQSVDGPLLVKFFRSDKVAEAATKNTPKVVGEPIEDQEQTRSRSRGLARRRGQSLRWSE